VLWIALQTDTPSRVALEQSEFTQGHLAHELA
jgi:hypothetical protein